MFQMNQLARAGAALDGSRVEGWCRRTVVAEAEGRLGPLKLLGCRILDLSMLVEFSRELHWLDLSVLECSRAV